jgi:DNA-binding transcriptional ArsR family regulator
MEHDRSGALDAPRAVAELSRHLAHPLRIVLLTHVADHGPCPFSELVEVSGATQAQVGNHLSSLRKAGLLATERAGRQSLYRMPNAHLAEVLANLAAAAGVETGGGTARGAGCDARGCYDHIGGKLGVSLLRELQERGALVGDPLGPDDLTEGPAVDAVLPLLGLTEWTSLRNTRRRFAYGCPDWTEHAPHLAGALGAAVSTSLHDRGWIRARPGSRILEITKSGRAALSELGIAS